MAVKFTKVCGSNRPRTKLDFGRVTKKITKISDPGCCVGSPGVNDGRQCVSPPSDMTSFGFCGCVSCLPPCVAARPWWRFAREDRIAARTDLGIGPQE